MGLEVFNEAASRAALAYADISIAFTVQSRFRVDVLDGGLGGFHLTHELVSPPYIKDYDTDEGEGPAAWTTRWDLSNWRVFVARKGGQGVGGAVVAFNTNNFSFLEGSQDIAALWDIRVARDARHLGVGRALFSEAAEWARSQGCRLLKVETQNVNVPACRFYAAMGCELGQINRFAYLGQYGDAHPDEVQLVWYLHLDR